MAADRIARRAAHLLIGAQDPDPPPVPRTGPLALEVLFWHEDLEALLELLEHSLFGPRVRKIKIHGMFICKSTIEWGYISDSTAYAKMFVFRLQQVNLEDNKGRELLKRMFSPANSLPNIEEIHVGALLGENIKSTKVEHLDISEFPSGIRAFMRELTAPRGEILVQDIGGITMDFWVSETERLDKHLGVIFQAACNANFDRKIIKVALAEMVVEKYMQIKSGNARQLNVVEEEGMERQRLVGVGGRIMQGFSSSVGDCINSTVCNLEIGSWLGNHKGFSTSWPVQRFIINKAKSIDCLHIDGKDSNAVDLREVGLDFNIASTLNHVSLTSITVPGAFLEKLLSLAPITRLELDNIHLTSEGWKRQLDLLQKPSLTYFVARKLTQHEPDGFPERIAEREPDSVYASGRDDIHALRGRVMDLTMFYHKAEHFYVRFPFLRHH